jgi:hypothetical protein
MPKHSVRHKRSRTWLTRAAVFGGFFVAGVLFTVLVLRILDGPEAVAAPAPVVLAPAPDYVQLRESKAEVASRDATRLDRFRKQQAKEAKERRIARRERARERAAAEAAQAESTTDVVESPSSSSSSSSSGNLGSGSGSLPALLQLIRSNESGGNYSAYNGSGCEGYGCYGAYQLHGLYMDDWARQYGAAAYAGTPANQWPASVQDKVALGLFYSTNPDGLHWCNWTSYC